MSQSKQSYAADQLLELMLQLKKTTPAAAKQILNGQPQIAYALITLMVSMNAVNFEVIQKTLADFAASQGTSQPAQPAMVQPAPSTQVTLVSAIPPHLQSQSYRTPTPPTSTPTPPLPLPGACSNGHGQHGQPSGYRPPQQAYPSPQGYAGYGSQVSYPPPSSSVNYSSYATTAPASSYSTPAPQTQSQLPPQSQSQAHAPQQTSVPSINPTILAAIPDEQKAMVIQVLLMTQEQINMLPPQDRTNILQLRATFGL